MRRPTPLDRRTVLKGVGVALALPWLEAFAGARLPGARAHAKEQGGDGTPRRLAFLFLPNGVHMPDWTPRIEGGDFELPWILEPLAPHRASVLVLSGLAQDQARAHGDGPGDHARSAAVFLTGVHPVKTHGANIRVGVSADQVAARQIGQTTRFASLELGIEEGAQSGSCDSGYSCAYSSSIAWRTPSTPMGKAVDPRRVFERLFRERRPGETKADRERRLRRRSSVLDLVGEDARRLHERLGGADRAKLAEYLDGLRAVERRIEHIEAGSADAAGPRGPFLVPAGYRQDRKTHVRLMADLLVLAFQADATRVVTFMLGNGGSNLSYPGIGVPEAHHGLSHHGGDARKVERIRRINRFHMSQLAYLLERLEAVREGDGTLLDHTLVLCGSGIGDGNRHNHDELPVLVAGRAGGLDPGRHVRYPRWTPLGNLHRALLERVGATVGEFGDSTGPLPRLG